MMNLVLRLGVASALLAAGANAGAAELRAGAARVEITTDRASFPFQLLSEKPFVGVHDPVYARAIALEADGRRVVLVSIEAEQVPESATLVPEIARAAGISPDAVIAEATHTHGVPLVFYHGQPMTPALRAELDRVEHGAVDAAREAVAALRPASIAFARTEAFANMNNGEEKNLKGWFDPRGSSDKSLDLVRISGADGRAIALLVNYATHGEVMFRSVTRDGGYETTGDLPGAVSRILETRGEGAPVVMYTPGAEGDQLPLFKSLQPDAELPGTDEGASGWALLDLLARRIAGSAVTTLRVMPAGASDVRLGLASGDAMCPGVKRSRDPATHAISVADTAPVAIPVTVLRIGDIALAAVGADVASNIGAAIKAGSPVAHTTVMTMRSGAVGYVLNDAAYATPQHGAMGSPIKPGCAPGALTAAVARLATAAGRP